jgi:hypothetical protein
MAEKISRMFWDRNRGVADMWDEFNREQDADATHCHRQNALFKMICSKDV